MAQRDGCPRVKLSWQEALGEEAAAAAVAQAQAQKPKKSKSKKASPKPQPKDAKPKRKKRHPNDVRTEQDMDAIAGFDDSSENELEEEMDTFGGAGFVLVDLESELEELALVATEEGFANVRVGMAQSKQKRNNKKKKKEKKTEQKATTAVEPVQETTNKAKKTAKKVRQAQKLLETIEVEDVEVEMAMIETEKIKKSKKKKKGKEGKQEEVNAAATATTAAKSTQGKAKKEKQAKKEKKKDTAKSNTQGSTGNVPKNDKKPKKRAAKEKETMELEEKQAAPSQSRADGKPKSTNRGNRGNGQVTYSEYLDRDVVIRGLETGGLLQGKLRVNAMYRMDGYITVDGLSMDILVKGIQDRNRALDGDLVAVRLHPESEWKALDDEGDRRAVVSKPMSSSAGVDQNALHSLWLPSVETEKCFFKLSTDEENSADMLKQSMSRLNERMIESRRRPTASVVFILAQGNSNGFIGSLEPATKVKDLTSPLASNDNYAYFNADDQRLPRRIRIPRLQLPDEFVSRPLLYSKTMLCFCRIKAWSTRHQSPMGEFVKTVGEYTGIETGISAILSKHGLQSHTLDFDSSILNELDEKYGTSGEKWEIPPEELQKRRDFRDTQIFSIDPYNARDLDDALHIRALDDARTKFEIGVHIADVTHFIEHNSLLDQEARSRATSVYLANRVLPMLPRILCEKLCSLQPQVDRLAFSVVWQMNVDGTLVDGAEPWFGKSIIRSCCKLDYGSAQKMLDGIITSDGVDEWEEDRRPIPGANPSITNATVIQSVKDLWSIGENRRAMRFETGAVSLNDVKLVFSLDAMGNPTRYGSYELKDSNRLVEEYMLLANYLVAQQLLRAHGPLAFLRHHPPPVSRSMDQALELLGKSDINVDGRSTKQLTESLERVRQDCGETTFVIAQALIIKPMKPAEYMVAGNGASPDSWRHYALNIPYYTHFTSPIRRYADVVVHRLLQESVVGSSSLDAENPESRMVEFTSVAQNCNEKKMTSKNAEKECDKVFLCAYVQHHGDVEVTGVVLSMGQKSFTVYILELGLEQRLFLQEINLKGSWNEKTSQLSIRLPVQKKRDEDEDTKSGDHEAPAQARKYGSEMLKLSFMKQLQMRMSTTKKMPLALTFTVIGEKS